MEPDRQIKDLQGLLEISQALSGGSSLDDLLQIIVQKAKEVMEVDRCTLYLYDEASNELWSKIAEQLGDLREIRFPISVGIAGEVARTRKTVHIPDAYADPRFNRYFDQQTGFHTKCILSTPMINQQGKLVGVLQALNKRDQQPFNNQDEVLLTAMASHVTVAIERAQLMEAFLEKQRIEETLKLAHEIQMSMLPSTFPPFPNFPQLDLYATLSPAKEVGGDFYDFFLLDKERLFFAIGDVSGKGVPAALFMAVAKTLLKALVRKGIELNQVLSELNYEFCDHQGPCTLVTLFCGILNISTGEVLYANAGHNPPLLVRHAQHIEDLNEGGSLLLGVMDNVTYDIQRVYLQPSDSLFLYTDGVNEALNVQHEQFGEDRLKKEIQASQTQSSQQIVTSLLDMIYVFSHHLSQTDDITMMHIKLKDVSPKISG